MTLENIASLTDSIARYGVLQPIPVRRVGERFEIVAGERRWRAAKAAGLAEVPVIVREASDEEMLELALIENVQREDLNAIDRARAYRELCKRFGLRAEDVGQKVGEDRTTVTNYLRLLELPAGIQTAVAEGRLSMGHARCLLGVDDAERRQRLADSVVENELSVRALEEIVRREKRPRGEGGIGAGPTGQVRSAHVLDLQTRFEEALKTKVTIHEGRRKGTGRIIIDYFSLDDFDRIAGSLGVKLD
jgi:ParB family chromosome partitioning protein